MVHLQASVRQVFLRWRKAVVVVEHAVVAVAKAAVVTEAVTSAVVVAIAAPLAVPHAANAAAVVVNAAAVVADEPAAVVVGAVKAAVIASPKGLRLRGRSIQLRIRRRRLSQETQRWKICSRSSTPARVAIDAQHVTTKRRTKAMTEPKLFAVRSPCATKSNGVLGFGY